MAQAIKNRYDFVILFDVENGNPNGDPDAGNMPRVDPETGYGIVTDVCLKRKIRNYVEVAKEDEAGYQIYIKDQVPLNRSDKKALEYLGIDADAKDALKVAKKDDPELDRKIRDFMCQNFYDIRYDNLCKRRTELRAGTRPCSVELCTLGRSCPPAGSDHHSYCYYDRSGCRAKRH